MGACGPGTKPEEADPKAEAPAPVRFVDATTSTGLGFVHRNGATGQLYMPEILGPGGALFDYDNDGDLDIYLVQGQAVLGEEDPQIKDRLYRNDLERSVPHFTDVTEESGLEALGYGMGVAVADVDRDGWLDLYVTNLGRNQLFRNLGPDGQGTVRFEDVTEASGTEAGTATGTWSVSASFLDVDDDGWLDLFVGDYVRFGTASHRPCYGDSGALDYCGPLAFDPAVDRLYRNLGAEGRGMVFEDLSAKSAVGKSPATTLGVITADFDGNGTLDLYVANDEMPNRLWLRSGAGGFEDHALLAGCALNSEGKAESSMGVVAADFDDDGDEDLFLTHLRQQTNTIYWNDGQGFFRDGTLDSGLGSPSWAFTGFGAVSLDADNDGRLDLFVANGAVRILPELAAVGDVHPLHQRDQFFRNLGRGRFEEISERAGESFRRSEVGRGAAVGDVDNDGDADLLLVNNAGPARLLLNETGSEKHWIGLRVTEDDPARDALGVSVEVERGDGRVLHRRVRTDGSYASAREPRVLVGLADDDSAVAVRVRWPEGPSEEWRGLEADRYHVLHRGSGELVAEEGAQTAAGGA